MVGGDLVGGGDVGENFGSLKRVGAPKAKLETVDKGKVVALSCLDVVKVGR